MARFLADPNLFHFNRYSVSRAVFVGLFIAWLPIPGQLPAAAVLAITARCNVPVAMLLTCLNNPFTFALFLLMTYRTGAWLMGDAAPELDFSLSWEFLRTALPRYWQPLALGSISLGLVSGAVGALLARAIWRFYVVDRWRRRSRLRAARRYS